MSRSKDVVSRSLLVATVALLAVTGSSRSLVNAQETIAESNQAKMTPELSAAVEKDLTAGAVQSYAYFPGVQDDSFPTGELSTVVAGVRIQEKLYGKVSCYAIKADIGSPFQADQVIQNFTYAEPFFTVMQAKDKSLHLKVMPAKELSERKFFMTVYLLCKYLAKPPESPTEFAKGLDIVEVVYNQTVNMVDTANSFDTDFFVLVGMLVFMVFGMLYIFTDLLNGFKGSSTAAQKPKPKKKVETGTVEANGDEWLKGTFAPTQIKKKK